MSNQYSEEVTMLVDSLDKALNDQYDIKKRKALTKWDRKAWDLLAELGVLGINIPEEAGGFDFGSTGVINIYNALGRALVTEPVIQSAIIASEILAQSDTQQDKLESLISGEQIVVLAHEESNRFDTVSAVETILTEEEGKLLLSGVKTPIEWANQADSLIVSAKLNDEFVLCLVSTASEGVAMTDYPTRLGSFAAKVELNQVEITEEQIIAKGEKALATFNLTNNFALLALASYSVGAMESLIDLTKDYLRTRQQFKQPLANFQALQFYLADMYIAKEQAVGTVYVIAAAIENTDAEKQNQLISQAKIKLNETAQKVGEYAVQMHGGMGVTDEFVIGDYFKALTYTTEAYGSTMAHLQKLSTIEREFGLWE